MSIEHEPHPGTFTQPGNGQRRASRRASTSAEQLPTADTPTAQTATEHPPANTVHQSDVYVLPSGVAAIGSAAPDKVHHSISLPLSRASISGGTANGEPQWTRTPGKSEGERGEEKLWLVLDEQALCVTYGVKGKAVASEGDQFWLAAGAINGLELVIDRLPDLAEGSTARLVVNFAIQSQERVLELDIDTHAESGYDPAEVELAKGRFKWWRDVHKWTHEPLIPKLVAIAIPPPGMSLVSLPVPPPDYDPLQPSTFVTPFPPVTDSAQEEAWSHLFVEPLPEAQSRKRAKPVAPVEVDELEAEEGDGPAPKAAPARGKKGAKGKKETKLKREREAKPSDLGVITIDDFERVSARPRRAAHDRVIDYVPKAIDDETDYAKLMYEQSTSSVAPKKGKATKQPTAAPSTLARTATAAPLPAMSPQAAVEDPLSPPKKRRPSAAKGPPSKTRKLSLPATDQPATLASPPVDQAQPTIESLQAENASLRASLQGEQLQHAVTRQLFDDECKKTARLVAKEQVRASQRSNDPTTKWEVRYDTEWAEHRETKAELKQLKAELKGKNDAHSTELASVTQAREDEKDRAKKTERELRQELAQLKVDAAKLRIADLTLRIEAERGEEHKFELLQRRAEEVAGLNAVAEEGKRWGWQLLH